MAFEAGGGREEEGGVCGVGDKGKRTMQSRRLFSCFHEGVSKVTLKQTNLKVNHDFRLVPSCMCSALVLLKCRGDIFLEVNSKTDLGGWLSWVGKYDGC